MADVFVSYARADKARVAPLVAAIQVKGWSVWWDPDISPGQEFDDQIDAELMSAKAVVVVWTPTSVVSRWVRGEARDAADRGVLVPVRFEQARLPIDVRAIHTTDLDDWGEDPASAPAQACLLALAAMIAHSSAAQAAEAKAQAAPVKKEAPHYSVCVLPFLNMSGDPEQEYFSDGISEDIITDLSKVSALSVVARNTAFTFKGQAVDVKDVAQSLGVDHVLEGSVRKAGNRVRITAQLIDGKKGDHLWADRYDRDLTDIFAIQDEISKEIVAALRVKLLPEEKRAIETRGTSSVEAYNLFLMARQQWITGSSGDIRRDETIVRICKQALTFDPDYAQAWALMSLAQSQLRLWHAREEDALPAAERALAINPNIAEARCVKAHMLEEQGRSDEAKLEIETALGLDPESWEVNREAARLLFRQGKIREAIPYFEKATQLVDADWHNAGMLATCFHETGDADQLRRAAQMTAERVEKALAKDPSNASALASGAGALATFGESQKAKDWIERALLLDLDNILMRYNLACALATDIKDYDRALEVLTPYFERTVSRTQLRHAEVDPDLDPIRDDPKFTEMMTAAKARLETA